ncbi:MAG TPA: pentapeptide repeat-containing protein [Trebonia sp.]
MKVPIRLLALTTLVVAGLTVGTSIASADIQPLTFTPAPLAFGNVAVGTNSSASTTVTYTTSVSSTYAYIGIDSATPVGPNAADFSVTSNSCSLINIAGTGYNEQCSITVRFTPSAGGPESANLQVAWHNTGGASGTQDLALTGTGIPRATTTTLASSVNPATAGQAVTYTATVSPAPGGGTVGFTDNGSAISGCSAAQVSGTTATCATTAGTTGSHNIVATFSGSGGFAGSRSAVLTEVVTQAPCTSLAGCNLHGLNLSDANLAGTNLSNANLNKADLAGANLAGANLNGANLNGANLTDADLVGASLNGANLNGVTWNNTTCPDGTNSSSDGGTCTGHL